MKVNSNMAKSTAMASSTVRVINAPIMMATGKTTRCMAMVPSSSSTAKSILGSGRLGSSMGMGNSNTTVAVSTKENSTLTKKKAEAYGTSIPAGTEKERGRMIRE